MYKPLQPLPFENLPLIAKIE